MAPAADVGSLSPFGGELEAGMGSFAWPGPTIRNQLAATMSCRRSGGAAAALPDYLCLCGTQRPPPPSLHDPLPSFTRRGAPLSDFRRPQSGVREERTAPAGRGGAPRPTT